MATTIRANTLLQRLIGAAALDTAIYEEVEADPHATGQAMSVVVLSSVAMGVGARGLGGGVELIALFGVIALITWAAWALLMFELGTRLMPGRRTRSNPYELLRTLGFAATPGFAAVLAAVPGVAVQVLALTWIWMVAAMVVAVRQALDYESTWRAVVTCVLGLALALAIAIGIGMLFAPSVS
ncbi:MAG: YIP1 family protein [Vicinamibacterales bacterium]